jgi:hypothetical protein
MDLFFFALIYEESPLFPEYSSGKIPAKQEMSDLKKEAE